ncbi:MAG TPA: transaldolase family protein [Erysipelotrichaceae bacterium]|nr:fructose-6-phosphate aldolase [Erysipelotrichia bacterium]HPX31945.1 transaldolase family protein [Erysipelotrichaceae bacterium]HQA84457.1 transaldolase family protein [Erysipelotrichaceae bacterium]
MKLIIDTANAKEIKRLSEILNVWGVTTNPTIITRENKPFKEVIDEIDKVLKEEQMLFVQVISTDYESMVKEGRYIASLRKNIAVKIPVTAEGLKTIKTLHKEKIKVLATAIFNANQGFVAALNGAEYLAPYVNKMSNYTDGIEETIILQEMLDANGLNSEIIAASLKNTNQVKQLIRNGIGAVTVPVDIADLMYLSPITDESVNTFVENWFKAYNKKSL